MGRLNESVYPFPFLYGAQYYRAPTPRRKYWADDLRRIREKGFNTVKFWIQWRWSERSEGEYCWDDLDELMMLAEQNSLHVVLNLILDVMPEWVARDYPETLMVDCNGKAVPSQTTLCRQLGGYPGPCHSNELMLHKRKNFVREAVKHFRNFSALLMWDVWNEPERHLGHRSPDLFPDLCYCQSCQSGFLAWLKRKYGVIEHLNEVWGRCYTSFEMVEIPLDPGTVNDFIDWREFQLQVLSGDAEWRLKLVRELDRKHFPHLHVVPNVSGFTSLTCVDDFALAENCDIFGASMMNDPYYCAQGVSAAQGRPFYNAEWHINYGGNNMYQRVIGRDLFFYEQLPQLGWGCRGVLFWQYRSETLGTESPAWGLVRPDGTDRPVAKHAEEFIRAFAPYAKHFMECRPQAPKVLIWRGIRNELFQFCRHGKMAQYHIALKSYSDALYALNIPFGFADSNMLDHDTTAQILILPQAYYLEERDVELFDRFLRRGKVIISEGNLAAYSSSQGYFCETVPGCGLDEKWGIRELETTSSFHLSSADPTGNVDVSGDVKKALESDGCSGSEYFKIQTPNGISGPGAVDFSIPEAARSEILGYYNATPCILSTRVENGTLLYAGTMLGYAAQKDNTLLLHILKKAAETVGVGVEDYPIGLHVDRLFAPDGNCDFLIFTNNRATTCKLDIPLSDWHPLLAEQQKDLLPKQSACFIRK